MYELPAGRHTFELGMAASGQQNEFATKRIKHLLNSRL